VQSRRIWSLALALVGCVLALTGAACHATGRPTGASTTASVEPLCPPGAELRDQRCVCRADLRLLLGACVAARTASEYCGPSAFATADGCALRPSCEPGRARELVSSECLARRDVRNLAASLGILVADDELLGCPAGSELCAVTGDEEEGSLRLGCLPRAVRSTGGASCGAGSLAVSTRCEPLLHRRSPGASPEIDVVRWVEQAIGADGGPGAAPLCRAWARAPAFLGSATPIEGRFGVTLLFPDNDVSLVVAEVAALQGSDAAAATELDRVLRPMVEALRALGKTASQASLTTTVRCARTAGARPSGAPTVPAENDHER
jgi:hypothetical protein